MLFCKMYFCKAYYSSVMEVDDLHCFKKCNILRKFSFQTKVLH